MMEGLPPLIQMHPMRVIKWIPLQKPPTFTKCEPSQQLRTLVEKCLIVDAKKRYSAVDLLLSDIFSKKESSFSDSIMNIVFSLLSPNSNLSSAFPGVRLLQYKQMPSSSSQFNSTNSSLASSPSFSPLSQPKNQTPLPLIEIQANSLSELKESEIGSLSIEGSTATNTFIIKEEGEEEEGGFTKTFINKEGSKEWDVKSDQVGCSDDYSDEEEEEEDGKEEREKVKKAIRKLKSKSPALHKHRKTMSGVNEVSSDLSKFFSFENPILEEISEESQVKEGVNLEKTGVDLQKLEWSKEELSAVKKIVDHFVRPLRNQINEMKQEMEQMKQLIEEIKKK